MSKPLDITGMRFGRLTAIRPTEKRSHGRVVWECKCDCGNTVFAVASNLKDGNTGSCGCGLRGNRKSRTGLVGRRFGRLVVLEASETRKYDRRTYLCRCDCGNTVLVPGANLTGGNVQSCGCLRLENSRKYKDLTGMRFHKLTVLWPAERRDSGNIVWECKCDCGKTTFVGGSNLKNGTTKSCGCLRTREGRKNVE